MNPNITAGNVARVGKVVGKASLVAAPLLGAAQSAFDTPEDVSALGESVGLDPSTGRIGSNVVNFLNNTGNAATFGVAGRVGRMLAGGSFFNPDSAAPVKAAVPTASTNDGLPTGPQKPVAALGVGPGVSQVTTPEGLAAAKTALEGPYTGDQPVGTGFIRNNATGDTRVFRGGGATPTSNRASNDKFGFGELISGIRKTKQAAAKTAELAAKGAYLRGEAAFMKAEEGNSKPENTTVIPSAIPGGRSEVIQVKDGVAKSLTVKEPMPAGYTAASLQAEAEAAIKRDPKSRAAIMKKLASYDTSQ